MFRKKKKRIIVGAYETIGTGQNLQAPIGSIDQSLLVRLNDVYTHGSNEVNLNACYLEMPRNILSQFEWSGDSVENKKNLMNSLSEIESLYAHDEISFFRRNTAVNNLFDSYIRCQRGVSFDKIIKPFDNKYFSKKSTDTLPSVIKKRMDKILQAIGRMNRSSVKFRDCFIGYEHDTLNGYFEILDVIDEDKELPLLPEFDAIIKHQEQQRRDSESKSRRKNRERARSKKPENLFKTRVYNHHNKGLAYTKKIQKNVLEHNWTVTDIEDYERLGQLVTRYPTLTEEEFLELAEPERALVNDFYVKVPNGKISQYSYEPGLEDRINDVSLNKHIDGWAEVSMRAARLDRLCADSEIKKYMAQNGLQSEWKPGEWIMTPILFNNFYKARISEAITRFIFERYLGIKLEKLEDEIFESFDFWYTSESGERIMVDVKHHSDRNPMKDRNYMIQKTDRKLKFVNKFLADTGEEKKAKCLYVNMLYRTNRDYKRIENYGNGIFVLSGLITDLDNLIANPRLQDILRQGKW